MTDERWVNAVITCIVPLEVSPDAPDADKLDAAVGRWEEMDISHDFVCDVSHETVGPQGYDPQSLSAHTGESQRESGTAT